MGPRDSSLLEAPTPMVKPVNFTKRPGGKTDGDHRHRTHRDKQESDWHRHFLVVRQQLLFHQTSFFQKNDARVAYGKTARADNVGNIP